MYHIFAFFFSPDVQTTATRARSRHKCRLTSAGWFFCFYFYLILFILPDIDDLL